MKNSASIKFLSLSQNESFARMCVSAFIAPLDPTISELSDVKTAVSEAVTNAIVHGYGDKKGYIEMRLEARYREVHIEIMDDGVGISDIVKARQPFFTTAEGEERSGMGFTVMESFMDGVAVHSAPGRGTAVRLTKRVQSRDEAVPRRA